MARVAGGDRVDAALPDANDPVVVQWLEDHPAHGLLTGSPVRHGVMPEAEFRDAHTVVRSSGFGTRFDKAGVQTQTLASWKFVVEGVCDGAAEKFDFNPYRK